MATFQEWTDFTIRLNPSYDSDKLTKEIGSLVEIMSNALFFAFFFYLTHLFSGLRCLVQAIGKLLFDDCETVGVLLQVRKLAGVVPVEQFSFVDKLENNPKAQVKTACETLPGNK